MALDFAAFRSMALLVRTTVTLGRADCALSDSSSSSVTFLMSQSSRSLQSATGKIITRAT